MSRQQLLPPLVDASGQPLRRTQLMGRAAHRGGDPFSREMGGWQPYGGSADSDLLGDLPLITARTRDIARNEGFASGVMKSHLDAVIGSNLRLSAKPDWRALGLSPEWAAEWSREVETRFRLWGSDPRKYSDAARQLNFGPQIGLAYSSLLLNGGALANMLWMDRRPGVYATTVQLIETDRLSNPNEQPDTDRLRGGVELDEYGAAIAYHIRKRHPGDAMLALAGGEFEWVRVQRETPWGRPVMIHAYEVERVGQSRGKPIMAAVLEHMKQLWRFRSAELEAALINAIFAAVIESPFDPGLLDESQTNAESWDGYQTSRSQYRENNPIKLDGGVRIPHLFPGEKMNFLTANRSAVAYEAFESSALRNVAAATGQTYEQVSRDWSKSNYSSARGAMLDAWRGFYSSRSKFGADFATPIYACWLEEAIDKGDVILPPGAPSFHAAYAAWTSARWLGPSMGMIDPLKEADAIGRKLDLGITTLEAECASNGQDWDEVLEQQAREMRKRQSLGLPQPGEIPMARQYPSDPPPPAGRQGNEAQS